MMMEQSYPLIFLIGPVILIISGIILFSWGKRLPGKGVWLIWVGLFFVLALLGFDTGVFLNQGFITKLWSAGWIWDRRELGAITVGLFQDRLSAVMILALAVSAGLISLNKNLILKEQYPERLLAGLSFSTAGVCLAWVAMTPWVVFLGLALCLLGAVAALGSRWKAHAQADATIKMVLDRSMGLILALVGMLILSRFYSGIFLHQPEIWLDSEEYSKSKWIGSVFLVLGLFAQMQPFPLLKWLCAEVELFTPFRVFLCQVCPAWAALSLLIRIEPQLTHLGLFPLFGWIALISAVLLLLSGLFQEGWKQSLNLWLSGGFSLTLCLLAFCGALSATSLFLGVSFGSMVVSIFFSSLARDSNGNLQKSKQFSWLKASLFLAVSSGTGMVGFVSAKGIFYWILQGAHQPGLGACFVLLLSLFSLLGWKIAWGLSQLAEKKDAAWSTYASVFLFIVFSIGFFWTGSLTGHLLPGESDHLMVSLFERLFGENPTPIEASSEYFSALGLYIGVMTLSFIFAFWSVGRREDQWQALASHFPRCSEFVRSGYGTDYLGRSIILGLKWLGWRIHLLVDQKISSEWVPLFFYSGVKHLSESTLSFDQKVILGLNQVMRRVLDIPAKFLQTLQTGDLRWYLFLALGSGFAMLTHFLMR